MEAQLSQGTAARRSWGDGNGRKEKDVLHSWDSVGNFLNKEFADEVRLSS